MKQHNPRDIKREIKQGENYALYLTYLSNIASYTVAEASLISGFSENVIHSALERKELYLSLPAGSKEGRILKKSLHEWMGKNEIPLEVFYKIKYED